MLLVSSLPSEFLAIALNAKDSPGDAITCQFAMSDATWFESMVVHIGYDLPFVDFTWISTVIPVPPDALQVNWARALACAEESMAKVNAMQLKLLNLTGVLVGVSTGAAGIGAAHYIHNYNNSIESECNTTDKWILEGLDCSW